jgi:capsular exopolysaccharide synthesis family protein
VSIALSGRSVLVIECDLRSPGISQLFSCQAAPGISEVLRGQARIEDAVKSSEVDNLDILSAGEKPSNPAELLASKGFKELIKKVEAQYDFVILDCPPVLAVSDPCIVSEVAGAMVVIVKLTPNSRVELRRTVEMLNDVNATMVGLVVNDSSLEDEATAGKQNGYMVGYGYGASGGKANGYYHSKTTNGAVATKRVQA